MLFDRIRGVVKTGTSVIYITHRLAELRQIAHRVTVLRDGQVRGGGLVGEIRDAELLNMIVGRPLGSAFPPKAEDISQRVNFSVSSLSGKGFQDISFEVARGRNRRRRRCRGQWSVRTDARACRTSAIRGGYQSSGASAEDQGTPAERRPSCLRTGIREGLAPGLTVRENASFAALDKFAVARIVSRKKELEQVGATFSSLAVKTPSMEAPILSLSGGNQQKVVMSRALLSEPGVIVADEPTQGVDVGARVEIYRISA